MIEEYFTDQMNSKGDDDKTEKDNKSDKNELTEEGKDYINFLEAQFQYDNETDPEMIQESRIKNVLTKFNKQTGRKDTMVNPKLLKALKMFDDAFSTTMEAKTDEDGENNGKVQKHVDNKNNGQATNDVKEIGLAEMKDILKALDKKVEDKVGNKPMTGYKVGYFPRI